MIKIREEDKRTPPLRKITISTFDLEKNQQEAVQQDVGRYPMVYYNGHIIDTANIRTLTLDMNDFLPTMKVFFNDPTNIVMNEGFPIDDTIISVYIRSNSEVIQPIRMDFKIVNFTPKVLNGESKSYEMDGFMNVDNMFLHTQTASDKETSWKFMRKLAEQSRLSFASNIDDTDDEMVWINPGLRNIEFIEKVTEHAYLSDEAFLYSYVDQYYNLCYVDVETQLREDSSKNIGQLASGFYYPGIVKGAEPAEPAEIVLTNDIGQQTTENYFDKYTVYFDSTLISLQNGYLKNVYMYDRRGNWDGDARAGKFWRFAIDTITTPGQEDRSIILKGSPTNPDFVKRHITRTQVAPIDQDNMHKNYSYIAAQNKQNLVDLGKLTVVVELGRINFNLYKFQYLKVFFSNNSQASNAGANLANESLTGDWLIIGMRILYRREKGYRHELTLVKRELSVNVQDTPDDTAFEPETSDKKKISDPNQSNAASSASVNEPEEETEEKATDEKEQPRETQTRTEGPPAFEVWYELMEGKEGGKTADTRDYFYRSYTNNGGTFPSTLATPRSQRNGTSIGPYWHTNKGITWETWKGSAPRLGITGTDAQLGRRFLKMTTLEHKRLAKIQFWDYMTRNDSIKTEGVAILVTEWAWGAGPAIPVRNLQLVLNRDYGENLTIDGGIGPSTLAAIKRHDSVDLYVDYMNQYSDYIDEISSSGPNKAFRVGWRRRVKALDGEIKSNYGYTAFS